MSAIEDNMSLALVIKTPRGAQNDVFEIYVEAHGTRKMAFFNQALYDGDGHASVGDLDAFAVDYEQAIPLSMLHSFHGRHPEELVEGFKDARKPKGCKWMADSRIKSIKLYLGSLLVELEPA